MRTTGNPCQSSSSASVTTNRVMTGGERARRVRPERQMSERRSELVRLAKACRPVGGKQGRRDLQSRAWASVATIPTAIDRAISAAPIAPMSIPSGPSLRPRSAAATPAAANRPCRDAWLRREPNAATEPAECASTAISADHRSRGGGSRDDRARCLRLQGTDRPV